MRTIAVACTVIVSIGAAQAPMKAAQARISIGQTVVIEDAVSQVSIEPQSGFAYLKVGGELARALERFKGNGFPVDVSPSSGIRTPAGTISKELADSTAKLVRAMIDGQVPTSTTTKYASWDELIEAARKTWATRAWSDDPTGAADS